MPLSAFMKAPNGSPEILHILLVKKRKRDLNTDLSQVLLEKT